MKKKTIPKSDRPKKNKIKNNIKQKIIKKMCKTFKYMWTCAIGKMGGREER